MKKIVLSITLIFAQSQQPIYSMEQYEKIEITETDFKNVVLYGSLDDLKKYIDEHDKTYVDVLTFCATHNTDAKVAFTLLKLLPQDPQEPEVLMEFSRKEDTYYNHLWCGMFPTTHRLSYDENLSWCNTWCIPCLMFVDILACCYAPRMNPEENNAYKRYTQEHKIYERNKNVCRVIRAKALQNNALIFVKAFDKHRGVYIQN